MRRGAERLGLIESRRALCCRPFWRISEEIYLIVWNRVYAGAGGRRGGAWPGRRDWPVPPVRVGAVSGSQFESRTQKDSVSHPALRRRRHWLPRETRGGGETWTRLSSAEAPAIWEHRRYRGRRFGRSRNS